MISANRYRMLLGVTVLSASVLLYGCSKKDAAPAPTPAEVQRVNVPQFLATAQGLPPGQRKDYVKQHPAEEQAVLQNDDPRATQALTSLLNGH